MPKKKPKTNLRLSPKEIDLLESQWKSTADSLRKESLKKKASFAPPPLKLRILKALKEDGFQQFLNKKFPTGKVKNPNPRTQRIHPTLALSTALKMKSFREQMREEYEASKREKEVHTRGVSKIELDPKRYEKVWIEGYSAGEAFFGDEFNEVLKSHGLTTHDLLDLSGVSALPDLGKHVRRVSLEYGSDKKYPFVKVALSFKEGSPVNVWKREILFEVQDGKTVIDINNDELFLKEGAPEGLGTKILAHQIASARKAGVRSIQCIAFRNDDDKTIAKANGYYVWPLLGYESESFPPDHEDFDPSTMKDRGKCPARRVEKKGRSYVEKESLKQSIVDYFEETYGREMNSMRDFMLDDTLRYWWLKHGSTFNAVFDLSDRSKSLDFFNDYTEAKAKKKGLSVKELLS